VARETSGNYNHIISVEVNHPEEARCDCCCGSS